jgi:aryl-alcohol dehydrogenase-like predicted oxidoreductase
MLPAGMTLPEMALRFILSHPAVSTAIIGMRDPEHVRQNVAASDAGPLDAGLLAELKKHRWDRKPQRWSD